MTDRDRILSEFIDAWNAGERPRARQYLARVPEGPQRDELADRIGTWLETAPTPQYDATTRDAIRAEPIVQGVMRAAEEDAGLWPQVLPGLRARAGLTIREVAGGIVRRLGLSPDTEERTAGYLERMERGDLEPAGVSRRLLLALGDVLGASARTLADAGLLGAAARPAGAGGMLFRADEDAEPSLAAEIDALSRAAMAPAPEPLDEVDRLFLGGPDG